MSLMLTGSLSPVTFHNLDSVLFSSGEDIALPSFHCENPLGTSASAAVVSILGHHDF